MRGLCIVAATLAACGGTTTTRGAAPSSGARGVVYTDNSGITVATAAVTAEQPVGRDVTVSARALVDDVTVRRKQIDPGDPGANGQPTGHPDHDPDAVTSASATAGDGAVAEKQRWEGQVQVELGGHLGDAPARGWLAARASTEPDYRALAVGLGGELSLNQQNTTIAATLGVGRDGIDPVEAPPGEQDDWPASHRRLTAAVSGSQIAARTLLLGAGAALTLQRGRLASPYRRALVRTTLFPEVVPDERDRLTAFAQAAWSLSPAVALHLRQGLYVDSWDVRAFIPEAALAIEPSGGWLITAHYRFYLQSRAEFYQARYDDLAPLLSGDPRLGPIRAHATGVDLRWELRGERGNVGAITLDAGYELQLMDFRDFATDLIVGHTATLALILWR